MGNRAAKVSEDSKRIDDEDDVSTKEEKQIVIADSREDQEVRAGCVYVLDRVRTMFRHFADLLLRTGTVWEILQKAN